MDICLIRLDDDWGYEIGDWVHHNIIELMGSIAEEKEYESRIKFYSERLQTCGYRFYDMVQTRSREVPKLLGSYKDEAAHIDVENKVLRSANVFINCLHGEHHSTEIPEYLTAEYSFGLLLEPTPSRVTSTPTWLPSTFSKKNAPNYWQQSTPKSPNELLIDLYTPNTAIIIIIITSHLQ